MEAVKASAGVLGVVGAAEAAAGDGFANEGLVGEAFGTRSIGDASAGDDWFPDGLCSTIERRCGVCGALLGWPEGCPSTPCS